MKTQNKKTISIGISALNEGQNISKLLSNISNQNFSGLIVDQIILISDGSTDDTVSIARSSKLSRLVVYDFKKREGKNIRLNQIISKVNSDYLMLLDADIVISDNKLVQKLLRPLKLGVADIVSVHLEALSPRTIFERAMHLSVSLKQRLVNDFKSGTNVYNCHGPARMFTRKFYKRLKFPDDVGDDTFSYLFCVKNGYRFNFVPSAKVSYRLPSTPQDHYKQSSRFLDSIENCKKHFGNDFVNEEFNIPIQSYFITAIRSIPLIWSNLLLLSIYVITYLLVLVARIMNFKISDKWNVASSKALT